MLQTTAPHADPATVPSFVSGRAERLGADRPGRATHDRPGAALVTVAPQPPSLRVACTHRHSEDPARAALPRALAQASPAQGATHARTPAGTTEAKDDHDQGGGGASSYSPSVNDRGGRFKPASRSPSPAPGHCSTVRCEGSKGPGRGAAL